MAEVGQDLGELVVDRVHQRHPVGEGGEQAAGFLEAWVSASMPISASPG